MASTDDFTALGQVDEEQRATWRETYRSMIHNLRDLYDVRLPNARRVCDRAEKVLRQGITNYSLNCEVTSRIKDFNSFRLKFRKKFNEYQRDWEQCEIATGEASPPSRKDYFQARIAHLLLDPFSAITDLIGIRCIGPFGPELYPFDRTPSLAPLQPIERDKPRLHNDYYAVRELIINRFNDAGKRGPNPSPRSDEKLDKSSGYRAVHYDLTLKAESIVPSLEHELLKIPFELQVCTYSQHMIDDVSHFLSYKSDDIFYPSGVFQERTADLQNQLVIIQKQIDELFVDSRVQFRKLLADIEGGQADNLLNMKVITPDTLRLYAIFEFVILKNIEMPGLPHTTEEARFVELWLRELSDGLKACRLETMRQVQEKTREGIPFVERYAREELARKTIFKQGDLTDVLSKCLLFSVNGLDKVYPVLNETWKKIEKYRKTGRT